MIDRKPFYDAIRRDLFGGVLNQKQVDGIEAILNEWDRRKLTDLRYLAYMLATAYHEVDKTMQPIREYGGEAYFHRMYDITGARPGVARHLGNLYAGDGARFHGRGLVQLTGRKNYERMTAHVARPLFGVDLEKDPDEAMKLPIAVAIMFEGMLDAESSFGDFTGLALDDFFNATKDDPIGARKIINGTDKDELIAEYHRLFLGALEGAT